MDQSNLVSETHTHFDEMIFFLSSSFFRKKNTVHAEYTTRKNLSLNLTHKLITFEIIIFYRCHFETKYNFHKLVCADFKIYIEKSTTADFGNQFDSYFEVTTQKKNTHT